MQLEACLLLEQAADLVERGLAFGLDVGFARIKKNAVNSDLAVGVEPLGDLAGGHRFHLLFTRLGLHAHDGDGGALLELLLVAVDGGDVGVPGQHRQSGAAGLVVEQRVAQVGHRARRAGRRAVVAHFAGPTAGQQRTRQAVGEDVGASAGIARAFKRGFEPRAFELLLVAPQHLQRRPPGGRYILQRCALTGAVQIARSHQFVILVGHFGSRKPHFIVGCVIAVQQHGAGVALQAGGVGQPLEILRWYACLCPCGGSQGGQQRCCNHPPGKCHALLHATPFGAGQGPGLARLWTDGPAGDHLQCRVAAADRAENHRPSMSLRFCTAAPLAPLPRLSRRATSTAWR